MNQILGIFPVKKAVILPRFQTKAGESFIGLEQIVHLSAQGNYTVFHLLTGETVLTSLSLSTYSALLEMHGFMQTHKSHLLNLHYLDQCYIHHFLMLTLPAGQTLEIARRKRAALRKILKANKNGLFAAHGLAV